jgi:hypothetical protein
VAPFGTSLINIEQIIREEFADSELWFD